MNRKKFKSGLTGQEYPESQKVAIVSVRSALVDMMIADHPEAVGMEYISINELYEYRQRYIESALKIDYEDLSSLKKEVLDKITNHELVSEEIEKEWSSKASFGQRVADKVASFGGSWRFIIMFALFIVVWIIINIYGLLFKNYDPYPFILLNLLLSCLAALQAPVIMMSQNRSEEKDRHRAKDDYRINLKSEIEIQTLHDKIDHLIINQQGRLFEIQNIQVEMLKDIMSEITRLRRDKGVCSDEN